MKETQIQKQLNDFKCFKDHYTKADVQILDEKSRPKEDYKDVDTDRILVLADNPYQLNIAIQDTDHHGKIYHLSEKAKMTEWFPMLLPSGNVIFKDKDRSVCFKFYKSDWKYPEPKKSWVTVRQQEVR